MCNPVRDSATILSKGLLLECRQVLLPWNATLAELLVLGDPLVEGSELCLKWPNERILGGLSFAYVSTDAYSPGLHSIRCQPDNYTTGSLEPEFSHLSRVLGPPTRAGVRGGVWELQRVKLELCLHSSNEFQYTEDYHKWVYIEYDIAREPTAGMEKELPPFPYDQRTQTIRLPADIEHQLQRLVLRERKAEAANIVNKLTEARLRGGAHVVESYLADLTRRR